MDAADAVVKPVETEVVEEKKAEEVVDGVESVTTSEGEKVESSATTEDKVDSTGDAETESSAEAVAADEKSE